MCPTPVSESAGISKGDFAFPGGSLKVNTLLHGEGQLVMNGDSVMLSAGRLGSSFRQL